VGQRLARKQIDLAQRFGVETVRGSLIQARLTQPELAEMIGTTRKTLAHSLAGIVIFSTSRATGSGSATPSAWPRSPRDGDGDSAS
jgi:hypothetical protein